MRVLVIGFPHSIHIARALGLLARSEVDVHVVPSVDEPWLREITDATLHHLDPAVAAPADETVRVIVHHPPAEVTPDRSGRADRVAAIVREIRPHLVHAHEFQASGVLAAAVSERLGRAMPPLVVSNWGSDAYWFARTAAGRRDIRRVLAAADALACESERDVGICLGLGFRGTVLPVQPIAGGLDHDQCEALAVAGPVSGREGIIVKGRESWAGRAGRAVAALAGCGELLTGRELILHSASPGVPERFSELAKSVGARFTLLDGVGHAEVLRAFGRSRVSLAVSASDGISQTLLEAMACGAFPVQTHTATVREWFVDGVGGLAVDVADHMGIVRAVRRALTDDALVDGAPVSNRATLLRRADRGTITRRTLASYRSVLAAARPRG
ncbi:MAG: glycosyltransferase [Miltoncostaeaceae bacterium]